ncbi:MULTISPECIES: arsenate reductase (glutaredoxin) [Achromobacter]|uniref:Arsenate reductase n=1 Tax=Achromobacter aegrifaciens TaxID=1287736 RepID=A0AAD2IX36_ACHAE|nr:MULTISPECIES: arsenate reductase (glutaredoxin) [Achromobacter]PTN51800.1 arsenate reductase (glutaredoxin) [Achromobacter xylosoxidans]MBD9382134.1 arsenate reductase (glutaredoxin) [Achromobacter sp. ACM02]MBD9420094.1 arsenate reductase (glutaredoxin) [Achromobacter sp. ACM04]MBD9472596.1 arsenate reductase (glutaredoxin) [Achromobacter sp. ACM01]MDQ1762164.1 arsenate reductase (glutaredoxin) [Achromobacter aegrifaciens]
MSDVTIYHNPKCGTSRNTLAMIRNAGIEPEVVLYLETPPSRATLKALFKKAGVSVREALREKGTPYLELGLDDASLSDDALLDAIEQHPILLNRPFVATPLGARLCRPSELVLDILPAPQQGAFAKEDGEAVIDAQGKRIQK